MRKHIAMKKSFIEKAVKKTVEGFLRGKESYYVLPLGGVSLRNNIPEDDLLAGEIILYSDNDVICSYCIDSYVDNFFDLFTNGAVALKKLEEDIALGVIVNTPDEYIIAEEA